MGPRNVNGNRTIHGKAGPNTIQPCGVSVNSCAATKAWKTIQGSGDLQGQLSKVIQGPNEAYADLVARLMQTAGRIFGEVEAAMPLIKQLAYEQANKWCKEAIRPWKSKDLSTYIKVCRDINDSVIQGQVMAAAITQGLQGLQGAQQYKHRGTPGVFYYCKEPGHLKRECPERKLSYQEPKKPGICPRCGKDAHWAYECRSIRDIQGNSLPPRGSKNGKGGRTP